MDDATGSGRPVTKSYRAIEMQLLSDMSRHGAPRRALCVRASLLDSGYKRANSCVDCNYGREGSP